MSQHEYPFTAEELNQADDVFQRLVMNGDLFRLDRPEPPTPPIDVLWEHLRLSYRNVLGLNIEGLSPLGSAENLARDVRRLDILLHGAEAENWVPPDC